MKKVAVLMGGTSPERDISLKSGSAVAQALRKKGYHVVEVDVDRNVASVLLEVKPDCAFVALHGSPGEDGTVQGLLEIMGIPYTGSGVLGSALAMDKVRTKMILEYAGIPTPQWTYMSNGSFSFPPFEGPWVVKPSGAGSSIGVQIVRERKLLKRAVRRAFTYSREVLIEKFTGKWELTVAVLNGEALGTLELRPKKEFYSYEAKYTPGETDYIIPPQVPEDVASKAEKYAEEVFRLLDLNGAVRIDMRADEREVYVIEANTIPGLTETSLLPKIASYRGIDFVSLCEIMVEGARLHVGG